MRAAMSGACDTRGRTFACNAVERRKRGCDVSSRGWKKCSLLVCFAVLCVAALVGCSATKGVAATFGNHVITEDEVTAYTASYRAQNGLEDDDAWKNYVSMSYADTKTWREEAIRVLADELLVKDKAAEYGITADGQRVSRTIAEEKEKAGIAEDDDRAWADYLSQRGFTPESYREKLEYSSIEEQVYRRELNFTDELQSEMCTEYIEQHYADQVMHHYWAIPFGLDDEAGAQACFEALVGLQGDGLRDRFLTRYAEATGAVGGTGYDIGWDFLYEESRIDPEIKLRSANLNGGELYGGVLKGEDRLRVILCDERVELADSNYDKIESESFKNIIGAYTLATTWAAECNSYLTQLEEAAGIQVVPMPSNLPYAIES